MLGRVGALVVVVALGGCLVHGNDKGCEGCPCRQESWPKCDEPLECSYWNRCERPSSRDAGLQLDVGYCDAGHEGCEGVCCEVGQRCIEVYGGRRICWAQTDASVQSDGSVPTDAAADASPDHGAAGAG
jgi:hypothetical protein